MHFERLHETNRKPPLPKKYKNPPSSASWRRAYIYIYKYYKYYS